jgi:hypothetical protein
MTSQPGARSESTLFPKGSFRGTGLHRARLTLNDLPGRAGENLEAVEGGEVIISDGERRIAFLCPYPRGYRMDASVSV